MGGGERRREGEKEGGRERRERKKEKKGEGGQPASLKTRSVATQAISRPRRSTTLTKPV